MIYYDEIATLSDSDQEEVTGEFTEETIEELGTPTDALILEELKSVNTLAKKA